MTGLKIFLGAIACGWLWVGLIAPAILRSFGVPIAFGMWRLDRRNQNLSKAQYVWAFGVFSWGLGMFLFSTVWKYLEWRLLGDRFSYSISAQLIAGLLIWLLAGLLMGVLGAPRRKGADPRLQ